ncbi:hypothetical protein D3C73_1562140 [compost metagenome]
MSVVLDQKEQATEQAGDGGQQHQDNRGFKHGETPGGDASMTLSIATEHGVTG